MVNENNRVIIVGQVVGIEFSHECKEEKFYKVWVSTSRLSGVEDILPVIAAEILLQLQQVIPGCNIHIDGQYRSCNVGHKLDLFIFAQNLYVSDEKQSNSITITGYICKEPMYRETPKRREISDMLIAVNRMYDKSDYLPTICWGRNAQYVSVLPVGSCLYIKGRIQSREYQKLINGKNETRIAYEVSASYVKIAD